MSSQRLESGIGRAGVVAQGTGRRAWCADFTPLLSPALAVLFAWVLVPPRPLISRNVPGPRWEVMRGSGKTPVGPRARHMKIDEKEGIYVIIYSYTSSTPLSVSSLVMKHCMPSPTPSCHTFSSSTYVPESNPLCWQARRNDAVGEHE